MDKDYEIKRIMSLSDEEVLAETLAAGEDPDKVAAQCREIFERAVAQVEAQAFGSPAKQPQRAIRLRGRSIETVDLDDAGNVIEPVRCTCGAYVVFHRSGCPFAYGST